MKQIDFGGIDSNGRIIAQVIEKEREQLPALNSVLIGDCVHVIHGAHVDLKGLLVSHSDEFEVEVLKAVGSDGAENDSLQVVLVGVLHFRSKQVG